MAVSDPGCAASVPGLGTGDSRFLSEDGSRSMTAENRNTEHDFSQMQESKTSRGKIKPD